jgi:hypothetical protein
MSDLEVPTKAVVLRIVVFFGSRRWDKAASPAHWLLAMALTGDVEQTGGVVLRRFGFLRRVSAYSCVTKETG